MQTRTTAKISDNRIQVIPEKGRLTQIWGKVQRIEVSDAGWYIIVDSMKGEPHIAGIFADAIQKGDD